VQVLIIDNRDPTVLKVHELSNEPSLNPSIPAQGGKLTLPRHLFIEQFHLALYNFLSVIFVRAYFVTGGSAVM